MGKLGDLQVNLGVYGQTWELTENQGVNGATREFTGKLGGLGGNLEVYRETWGFRGKLGGLGGNCGFIGKLGGLWETWTSQEIFKPTLFPSKIKQQMLKSQKKICKHFFR